MNCREVTSTPVCLRSADGSKVSAIAFHELGLGAEQVMLNATTRYTDASGEVLYDPADFEQITVGSCPTDTQCVESQEWTYGIDNTGTNFRWPSATYEMVLSDGSTFQWTQTAAANGGWTPQMEEWGQEIQAAADAAGILWFVETRFRQPSDPSNLAGGGGFAGPPSLAVSNALTSMLWRYVNIQICPGQPVPVAANLIAVADAGGAAVPTLPYALTTDGAVLGPIQKFWLCPSCGEEPVWYLEDGVTPAEAGQIPNCWEPCGTLTLTEAPPDRECQFFFANACDNQNDPDPLAWIQDITRRTTVCNGEVLSVDYLQADPGDPTALVDYDLLGAFVDCASGEPIGPEVPDCTDYVYVGNLWKFVPQGEIGTLIEWWELQTGNGAPHDTPSNIFSLQNGTYEHPNGAPDGSYISPTFSATTSQAAFYTAMGKTSNADTNRTDQLKLSGYVNMPRAGVVSDTNPNTGERGLFAIQYCCQGDFVALAERDTDSVAGDTGIFTNVALPAGIHYVEIMTSDLSAWQGMQFSLSLDGGETTQPFISSTGKPYYECIPVLKCLDSGILVNADTGQVVNVEFNDTWCEPECNSPAGGSGGTDQAEGPTAQEIAAAMVTEQRNRVEGRMESWQNETNTQQLDVPPGTMGCLRSITDYGAGAVYWTIDGTTPAATNGSTMSVQYGNNIDLCGIDLSLVRMNGSSTGSDYSVTYEVWT